MIGPPARPLLAALAACVLALAAATTPAAAAPADPAPLLLRLPDLGPGYTLANKGLSDVDRRCLPMPFASDPALPALRTIGRTHPNRGCLIAFDRAWMAPGSRPGPHYVVSGAFTFADTEAPRAALARPRAVGSLVSVLGGPIARGQLHVVEPAPTIGDESVLLRYRSRSDGRTDSLAILVWRSGTTVAGVEAASVRRKPSDADEQAALTLAAAEQARIAAPTPLVPANLDDLEVPLDDPHLVRPVYWLGRYLPAAGRYPRLPLREVVPVSGAEQRKGLSVTLHYATNLSTGATIPLVMVDPKLLRRRAVRRELGRVRRERCTVEDRLVLPNGRATIFTGDRRRCPHYGDDVAFVRFPGVVVIVLPEGCQDCRGPVSRYLTRAGLRTIVHALRVRPPRPLPAPTP